ncbi:iron-sulfur cluster assembly enzyme ISCU, mitochondrial [Elysia marginata]|uniref:Iron-sulfur cluster assembly enzyme ISCU, mitochondrial n=1 Tax=Elysia marginata TaxID=1093978 RepID=A0AAV4EJW8_9GAST|nr:iron-sulfur cluster assembly enzyme ISCU, mitochondrial [Elysia marginata]
MAMLRGARNFSQKILPRLEPLLAAPAAQYHKNVIDHYENPRNVGSLDKNDKNVGTGLVGAPACGDVMKLQHKNTIISAMYSSFSLRSPNV